MSATFPARALAHAVFALHLARMSRPANLPRALRANALASLVTGLAGLLMSAPLAETIGLIQGTSYQVLGGALILHMLILLWASGRASIAYWTRLNLAVLTAYVLGLIVLLLGTSIATPTGQRLLVADALLVSALALWQARALSVSTPRPAQ